MRKNRAPKGSVPIVCYNKNTKGFIGLDAEHPLMAEDWVEPIGPITEYRIEDGKPRKAETPVVSIPEDVDEGSGKPLSIDDLDPDDLVIPEPTDFEALDEPKGDPVVADSVPAEPVIPGYYDCINALKEAGVPLNKRPKKVDVEELYKIHILK